MIWIVRKSSLILLMTNRIDKFFMEDSAREMAVSMKLKVSAVWFLKEPPELPLPAEGLEPGVLPPDWLRICLSIPAVYLPSVLPVSFFMYSVLLPARAIMLDLSEISAAAAAAALLSATMPNAKARRFSSAILPEVFKLWLAKICSVAIRWKRAAAVVPVISPSFIRALIWAYVWLALSSIAKLSSSSPSVSAALAAAIKA